MNYFDACPHCHANLRRVGRGSSYSRSIGVEIQGVYDGVLFDACPDCGGTWHGWDSVTEPRLWAAAEKHRARFRLCIQPVIVDNE